MSTPETKAKNPITLKIKFKSASLDQFIERYSVDVSKGGIFIRTKEPLAVGSQLKFEFQLQDGSPLLAGEGTVVWNRSQDQAKANAAPGMGVRFDKLTGESQRILDRILDEKVRRGEGQVESRYDAGMRAAAGLPDPAPSPSQATPDQGGFGDEPTRAMAADQVNRLAEQSAASEDDKMTRPVGPVPEEVRRAMNAARNDNPSMAPMAPIAPIKPPPGLGKTLLGQGFMVPRGPVMPAGKDGPSVEIKREPSGSVPTASGLSESAKTPTASPDEQQARIADSARTPTTGPVAVAKPAEPAAPSIPSGPTGTTGPTDVGAALAQSTPPQGSVIPAKDGPSSPSAVPSEPALSQPSRPLAPSTPPPSGGSSKALLIGGAVLVIVLGALGYVMFVQPRMQTPTTETPTSPGTQPGPAGTTGTTAPKEPTPSTGVGTPGTPPVPTEIKPVEPPKQTEVPVKPVQQEGVEVVTVPPGAMLDVGGKQYGPTPVRVPGLDVGSRIKISLRGYADAVPRLRNKPDETKPLEFKLTSVPRVIEVVSNPKGAEVFVDGAKVGKTPLKAYTIEIGKTHEVEVRRAGFVTWKQTVTDASTFVIKNKKEVLSLNATLEPEGGKRRGTKPEAPAGGTDAPPPADKAAPPASPTQAAPAEAPKPTEAPKPAEPEAPKGEPAKAAEPAKAPEAKAPEAKPAEAAPAP